jgi:hypothetical protein|tara:strand:- start:1883 stop:2074 length:192 start_codon:yes stop_codon:yes gene_type:complete
MTSAPTAAPSAAPTSGRARDETSIDSLLIYGFLIYFMQVRFLSPLRPPLLLACACMRRILPTL